MKKHGAHVSIPTQTRLSVIGETTVTKDSMRTCVKLEDSADDGNNSQMRQRCACHFCQFPAYQITANVHALNWLSVTFYFDTVARAATRKFF